MEDARVMLPVNSMDLVKKASKLEMSACLFSIFRLFKIKNQVFKFLYSGLLKLKIRF